MKFKKLLETIGKNLLAWFTGAILGMVVAILYLFWVWFPANSGKIGLGVIAVIPAMLMLFSVVGIVIGGVVGVVVYQVVRLFRREPLKPQLRPAYVKKIKQLEKKGKFRKYKSLSALRKIKE